MEIKKETTIKLSVEEAKEIIINHLKEKGMDVKSVSFNVSGHNDDDDWRGEYPLTYKVNDITCKCESDINQLGIK
jgi:hypothetical protein